MPQVDKATFLPIVLATAVIYVGGFLFLNSTSLFTLVSSLKLAGKRSTLSFRSALRARQFLSSLLFFPLLSL